MVQSSYLLTGQCMEMLLSNKKTHIFDLQLKKTSVHIITAASNFLVHALLEEMPSSLLFKLLNCIFQNATQ